VTESRSLEQHFRIHTSLIDRSTVPEKKTETVSERITEFKKIKFLKPLNAWLGSCTYTCGIRKHDLLVPLNKSCKNYRDV
jgi:hypothetical protein